MAKRSARFRTTAQEYALERYAARRANPPPINGELLRHRASRGQQRRLSTKCFWVSKSFAADGMLSAAMADHYSTR